jgi:hypothetical protein
MSNRMLGVTLDGLDCVPKKSCGLRPGVSDQGLGLGEFSLEFITQELPELSLDFFCF